VLLDAKRPKNWNNLPRTGTKLTAKTQGRKGNVKKLGVLCVLAVKNFYQRRKLVKIRSIRGEGKPAPGLKYTHFPTAVDTSFPASIINY
jgi:hypothetical protein